MHLRKVWSPDDPVQFARTKRSAVVDFSVKESLLNEHPVLAESVALDHPARTAQANMERHFAHMH